MSQPFVKSIIAAGAVLGEQKSAHVSEKLVRGAQQLLHTGTRCCTRCRRCGSRRTSWAANPTINAMWPCPGAHLCVEGPVHGIVLRLVGHHGTGKGLVGQGMRSAQNVIMLGDLVLQRIWPMAKSSP
jgi:hypothetical protein